MLRPGEGRKKRELAAAPRGDRRLMLVTLSIKKVAVDY